MSKHIHIHINTKDGLVSAAAGTVIKAAGTAVKAAKKLNEVHARAYHETGDAFEESEHPRGEGGKFSPYGGAPGTGYTKIPKRRLQEMHYGAVNLHGRTSGGHPEAFKHSQAIYSELERRRNRGRK